MNAKHLFLSALICLISMQLSATIILVPATYSSIQNAIDASVSGDTIEVSPGIYFENINYNGKNILLTSRYYLDNDTSYISSTILNGSQPFDPDTASCVIFNSGENATAILQGFTLTGGAGTKWTDIHGAGVYREGGGILIELSSPSILHNIIRDNTVTNANGVVSTGGGGIRIGDGNPILCGNLITNNEAKYGAGLVLNYTGCSVTNNIISSNMGGQAYQGGSGIWIYGDLADSPKTITNNTIVNNSSTLSSGTGGILVWLANNVILKNNILWYNTPDLQLKTITTTPTVSYSDIQGGYVGTGNLDTDPEFEMLNFYLVDLSPCIDIGDPSSAYNDLEDTTQPGNALFPSKGSLTNDMGAYGGPCTSLFPIFSSDPLSVQENGVEVPFFIYPNPVLDHLSIRSKENLHWDEVLITDVLGKELIKSIFIEDLDLSRLESGTYILTIFSEGIPVQSQRIIRD